MIDNEGLAELNKQFNAQVDVLIDGGEFTASVGTQTNVLLLNISMQLNKIIEQNENIKDKLGEINKSIYTYR